VVIVDVDRAAVTQRIRLAPGIGTVAFDPTGRWAFVLDPAGGRVTILDPSGAIPDRTIGGFAGPDAIAFTARYAYVRNRAAARLSLVQLEDVEKGIAPGVLEIPVGARPPAEAQVEAAASPLAPIPSGDGAFVASPADGTLVYYREGMMAPAGSHRNYGRRPRAALLLDRALREREPGAYATVVQPGAGGRWNVALLLDEPRIVHCFEQTIADSAEAPIERPLLLEPLVDADVPLRTGDPAVIRFRLERAGDEAPIAADEIVLVAVRPPHTWHRRLPVRAGGEPGVFEAEFLPPAPGRYRLNVAVPGRGARLGALTPITLSAVDGGRPADPAGSRGENR